MDINVLAIAGPGSRFQIPGAKPAGFWVGLWHGVLCPFTFIASLFIGNVRIYESHNRGRLYDFGFLIGAEVFGEGAGKITNGVS